MKRIPSIKSVMIPFPYAMDVEATLDEAREFMREHKIHHLPVTEAGVLAGIVSNRDITLLLAPDMGTTAPPDLRVRDAMLRSAYTVDLETRLDEVLEYLAEHHLSTALVTRHGKLAGVFTAMDACRAFAKFLQEQFRRSGGDDAA